MKQPALLALSSQRLYYWYAHHQKERWSEVAALIAAQRRSGDALVLDVMGAEAFHYTVEQQGLVARLPELWPRAGWQSATREPSRVWVVQNRARDFDAAKVLPNHAPLWTRDFEPLDEDASSLFADSRGRIIQVTLFER